MALSIFLILLVACLLFSLVLLWHLGWLHLPSSHSAVASRHSLVRRLRHRPAVQTIAPPVFSPPLPPPA
jgi:hypothetical protein